MSVSKTGKILIAVGTGVVILGGALFIWLAPGSTEDMQSVADSFSPPSNSELVGDRVTAPSLLCWGSSACPSLFRSWESSEAIDTLSFERMLNDAGWDFPVDGTCETSAGDAGAGVVCSATGESDGYKIVVKKLAPNSGLSPEILIVELSPPIN